MINWILLSFKSVEILRRKSTHILSVATNLNGLGRRSWLTSLEEKQRKYTAVLRAFVRAPSRRPIEIRWLLNTEFYDPPHLTIRRTLLASLITRLVPHLVFFFQFYSSCTISYAQQTILRYIKRLFSHLTDDTTNKI